MIFKTNSYSHTANWSQHWHKSYHGGSIILNHVSKTWGDNWSRLNNNYSWAQLMSLTWSANWQGNR